MSREVVTFENERGIELSGAIEGPEDADRGVVLCSHFTGHKDVGHLHRLALALAKHGVRALRFDYSDCLGDGQGSCRDMQVTHQVQDTVAALDRLRQGGVDEVGVWGHSLGGLTAIAAACETDDLGALSVVSAPAKLAWDEIFSSRADEWQEQGYVTFEAWGHGEIRVDYGFYRDLKGYDATEIIQDVDAPVQVVHAGADEMVDRKNSEAIFENAPEPKRFDEVEGAGHLFSDREKEAQMIRACREWQEAHL